MLDRINTKRVVGRLAAPDDENLILTVLNENIAKLELVSQEPDTKKEAYRIAVNSDLPPGGKKAYSRNMLLFSRSTDEVIGILVCYLGYPEDDICYVGTLFLRPEWQRKGLGKEIMSDLEKTVLDGRFNEFRIGVGLKNWSALKFWTALGYDKITKITGDTEFGSDKFATVELKKE